MEDWTFVALPAAFSCNRAFFGFFLSDKTFATPVHGISYAPGSGDGKLPCCSYQYCCGRCCCLRISSLGKRLATISLRPYRFYYLPHYWSGISPDFGRNVLQFKRSGIQKLRNRIRSGDSFLSAGLPVRKDFRVCIPVPAAWPFRYRKQGAPGIVGKSPRDHAAFVTGSESCRDGCQNHWGKRAFVPRGGPLPRYRKD